MTNPGIDTRFILRYLLSLAIGVAAFYLLFIKMDSGYTAEPIIDDAPVTVQLKKGTVLYSDDGCAEWWELGKLPKAQKATILASSLSNHNLLVATEGGWRGFVKKDDFAEGIIPQDHPFPGFSDDDGHRYSGSMEDFHGKRFEELEHEWGTATGIVPTDSGFVATFRMILFNSSDKNVYRNPEVTFVDSVAVDTLLQHWSREWSWTQYSPLFRLPIWLGYKVKPKQYKGYTCQQDKTSRSVNVWFKFKPDWLRIICNILLFFVYLAAIFYVAIRIPLLPFHPVATYLKYNFHLGADVTNFFIGVLFFLSYIVLTPFIAMNLSTNIWNLVWTVLLLGGGCYVFGKWASDISEKKCTNCNRYDSYDLTEHKFTHTTIEQRAESHTSHETRSGYTDSGQRVNVDVEVHHTNYYHVEVSHFDDTYTCRFCGQLKYDKSTEEKRLD